MISNLKNITMLRSRVLIFSLLVFSCLRLMSCETDSLIKSGSYAGVDSNFVSLDRAITVGYIQLAESGSARGGRILKKITSSLSVSPDGGDPSFYIINYVGGGFAVVSADNRIAPLLAHSSTGSFPLDQKYYPSALINWLQSTHEGILRVKKEKKAQTYLMKKIWEQYETGEILPGVGERRINSTFSTSDNSGPDACTSQGQVFYQVDQKNLGTATWDQWGSGYNDNVSMICSGNPGGRAPTGCVATALGIVLKYYQKPATYNWSSMYSYQGSPETAKLLNDLGQWYLLDMSYTCSGSSALSSKVPSSLSWLNYQTATKTTYAPLTVVNEIKASRPVILCGGRNANWWVFNYYTDGHCWVADGYYNIDYYTCQQNPWNPGQWEKIYTSSGANLYMNWGWGGQYNGWYSTGNFNPGSDTFNYNTEMIYNIIPK